MARKNRFAEGKSVGFGLHCESEGSGSSGRIVAEITASEDWTAPRQKWIDVNSASRGGFDVPLEVVPLSKLSPSEKKNLILRLRFDLERIQVLQKKIELQRTNAVTGSSSSDILSCSNIKKGPEKLNTKKISGQVSKIRKRPNSSSQKRGWNRGSSGRFESLLPGSASNSNMSLLKKCSNLLKKLMSHPHAWVFKEPVDVVKLNIPDYFNVIKHPMDLGTIKQKLASGVYSTPLDFLADVRLTFSNAKTYNPPGNNVHIMAEALSNLFELKWKDIEKEHSANGSQALDKSSQLIEENEIVNPSIPAKKRKLSPPQHSVVSEPVKVKMTDEEKLKLSRDFEGLNGDIPDNIIDLLKELSSNGGDAGEDEIEIDFEELNDDVLFTLRKLLDDHLEEKHKYNAIAEPCEIELPNESGLSSSSIPTDKGNDHIDEDIDIGGNELPVSSYTPVKIEKDSVARANKCITDDLQSDEPSDGEMETKLLASEMPTKDKSGSATDLVDKAEAGFLPESNQCSSGLDQLEQSSQEKPNSDVSDGHQDGESASTERQVLPENLYRAALLKNRFADTILKAREKTLLQADKGDPEKLRLEREKLEVQKMREKARLQAEARAAEDARKQAEAAAAAELKRKRELERAAARQALSEMEKTVEINEGSVSFQDLEMLRAGPADQLPSSVDESSPDHLEEGFGSFKFVGSNPLEQLGLYMKADDEEEEVEPTIIPDIVNDEVEEGEID